MSWEHPTYEAKLFYKESVRDTQNHSSISYATHDECAHLYAHREKLIDPGKRLAASQRETVRNQTQQTLENTRSNV